MKYKNVNKPLIKQPKGYMPTNFKHAILVNEFVKDIENDESIKVIVNGDSVD